MLPTAEPARRQPSQRLPDVILPGVLRTVLVLASSPGAVMLATRQEVLTLTTCLPTAWGRSEGRKCGGGAALACSLVMAAAKLGLPRFPGEPRNPAPAYTWQREALSPPLLLSGPLTLPPTSGEQDVFPSAVQWGEEAEAGSAPPTPPGPEARWALGPLRALPH